MNRRLSAVADVAAAGCHALSIRIELVGAFARAGFWVRRGTGLLFGLLEAFAVSTSRAHVIDPSDPRPRVAPDLTRQVALIASMMTCGRVLMPRHRNVSRRDGGVCEANL
jgi:hypothetical protein